MRIVGTNDGQDVTNGGIAGHGRFTATGAIVDTGTVVAYRTVKGNLDAGKALITLRFVTRGAKGAITYVVKIDIQPTTTTSMWTIASGTKAYRDLHGSGRERENAEHTGGHAKRHDLALTGRRHGSREENVRVNRRERASA